MVWWMGIVCVGVMVCRQLIVLEIFIYGVVVGVVSMFICLLGMNNVLLGCISFV